MRRPRLGLAVGMVLMLAAACGDDAAPVPVSALRSIEISPEVEIPVGRVAQLTATGTYDDGTRADVTTQAVWISSNAGIADITSSGAVVGRAFGLADIIATVGNTRASARVAIFPAALDAITILTPAGQMPLGVTFGLMAYGLRSDGSPEFLLGATWVSDAPEHVRILSDELAEAVSVGDARVTATRDGITSAPVQFTVIEAAITQLDIRSGLLYGSPLIAMLGRPLPLSAIARYTDDQERDVTAMMGWVSSDPHVATISQDGVVTPLLRGQTFVQGAIDPYRAGTTIEVIDATLSSFQVSVAPTLFLGEDQPASAIAGLPNGAFVDISPLVTWTSSDPDVATVSDATLTKGLVSPHRLGQATITATINGEFSSAQIVVEPATAAVPRDAATRDSGNAEPQERRGSGRPSTIRLAPDRAF